MSQRLSILPSRNASGTRSLGRGHFSESNTGEAIIMRSDILEGFAAFVGIDWADKKHDICVQVAGSTEREFCVLEHKPEAIDDWANGRPAPAFR
jgi:hypothetical protein